MTLILLLCSICQVPQVPPETTSNRRGTHISGWEHCSRCWQWNLILTLLNTFWHFFLVYVIGRSTQPSTEELAFIFKISIPESQTFYRHMNKLFFYWAAIVRYLPVGHDTVVSIIRSSHLCLYMEVELIVLIATPFTYRKYKAKVCQRHGIQKNNAIQSWAGITHHWKFSFICYIWGTEEHPCQCIIETVA